MKRCVILCASPNTSISFLKETVKPDDFLLCADGGYKYAEAIGRKPDLLIGDFDSSEKPESSYEIISFPPEKDDTDSFLALKIGIDRGFTDFLLLCGIGGRIDHTLANLALFPFAISKGVTLKIADEQNVLETIRDESREIKKRKQGENLSVFPLGGYAYGVTLKGVKYPLSEYTMEPVCPLGVSNEIIGDVADVSVRKGTLLIVRSCDTN